MTVDHRSDYLDTLRSTLSLAVYPLQYLVDVPTQTAIWMSENLVSRQALLEDNHKLREQHVLLNAKLQKLTLLEQENTRLRQLLASASRFKQERLLIAELLSVNLDPYQQQVVLNKGEIDGVFVGQPLLDAHGVMGQITHVTPVSATAILISDPSHALQVQVNRTGMRTVIMGTGNAHELSLRHIPASSDLAVGDFVSSSGLGGRFPRDYPVAEIIYINRPPGEAFAIVKAKPFAHLDRSREILLVWPSPPSAAMRLSNRNTDDK